MFVHRCMMRARCGVERRGWELDARCEMIQFLCGVWRRGVEVRLRLAVWKLVVNSVGVFEFLPLLVIFKFEFLPLPGAG